MKAATRFGNHRGNLRAKRGLRVATLLASLLLLTACRDRDLGLGLVLRGGRPKLIVAGRERLAQKRSRGFPRRWRVERREP